MKSAYTDHSVVQSARPVTRTHQHKESSYAPYAGVSGFKPWPGNLLRVFAFSLSSSHHVSVQCLKLGHNVFPNSLFTDHPNG